MKLKWNIKLFNRTGKLKVKNKNQKSIIESLKSEVEELKDDNLQQKSVNESLTKKINKLEDEKIKNDEDHSFAIKEVLYDIECSETSFLLQERQKIIDYLEFQHEILDSLNVVHNCLNDYLKNKPVEELNTANSLTNNLLKEISSFIEEERIYIGKDNFNHNNITDFSNTIKSVLEIYKPVIDSKQIELKTIISNRVYVKADPFAIEKIFTNVLENAIKYTYDKGNITVTLEIDKDKNILTIKDNGIGIPESDIDHIFKPFYRLNTKGAYKGFGCGLTMIKNIVDKIGGEITATAKLKKGAEFKIIFDSYKLSKGEKAPKHILSNDMLPNKFQQSEDIIEGERDTLLIVEDNFSMQQYLSKELKGRYNMCFAKNGMQALEKLGKLKTLPNMIISDIMMEKMNGIEFKTKLNSISDYKYIPFIFLTAKSSSKDKINALKLGSVDYILKPFNFKELEAKINSIITNNKAQKTVLIKAIGKNNTEEFDIEQARLEKLETKCKLFDLTKAENQVIELLLLKKRSVKEISRDLFISDHTTKKHITNIYTKMNVSGRDGAEKMVFDID